jgi:hypothetical protein
VCAADACEMEHKKKKKERRQREGERERERERENAIQAMRAVLFLLNRARGVERENALVLSYLLALEKLG